MIRRLCKDDYITSEWSGGTTTQIAIYPESEKYVDRNFLWRISSATIDVDVSDFTLLYDYNRFIATLDKGIELHQDGEVYKLEPLEIHYFDGGMSTKSFGRCRDFNLMLRKDMCSATVRLIDERISLISSSKGAMDIILFCICGSSIITFGEDVLTIQQNETIIVSNEIVDISLESLRDTKIYIIEIFR